jgi:hypothetical protein
MRKSWYYTIFKKIYYVIIYDCGGFCVKKSNNYLENGQIFISFFNGIGWFFKFLKNLDFVIFDF